jgi:acyl-CoA hydrolase
MSKYGAKTTTANDVAALVKDGMWLDLGCLQPPQDFDRALAARVHELSNIHVRCQCHLYYLHIMDADPEGKVFFLYNWHVLGLSRKYIQEGRGHYIPMNFGEVHHYYENIEPDIAVAAVSPMDKHGNFNFGPSVSYSKEVLRKAKIKVLEVNATIPWAYGGYDECVNIADVDYVYDNTSGDKIAEISNPVATDVDKVIAGYIADLIPLDGPTLQIGISGLPNAVLSRLGDLGARDIGIHSEMLTESMADLVDAGVITGKKKTFIPDKIVYTFSLGSRRLYDWMDHNPALAVYPVNFTNDPNIIAMNRNMVSINAGLGVDLQGQVSSESIGTMHYTGTGGQLAFHRGAYYRSSLGQQALGYPENKGIIAIYSTFTDKDGKLQSRIKPTLPQGEIVTVPRTDTSYIVTEYGVAFLRGLSIPERVVEIAKIAHPDFRDWLLDEARKIKWLGKHFKIKGLTPEQHVARAAKK